MKRQSKVLLMMVVAGLALVFVGASPATAAEGDGGEGVWGSTGLGVLGVGVGSGLVIMGAGAGIGRIGGSALESMARQPEVAGQVMTPMLITAALIEGATFFALIVIFLANGKL
jgi:F-type H+-transporting ATPase subunit c